MRSWFVQCLLLANFTWSCLGSFEFGISEVDISPLEPIRLSGYAARTNVSDGVAQRIFTKAIAIRDQNNDTALILTVENCGLSKEIRDVIVSRLQSKHSIPSERIVIFNSHTHTAPCLSNSLANLFVGPLPEDQLAAINRYTVSLVDNMLEAGEAAISKLAPGRIYRAQGRAGFAKNRRRAGGPVDHDLPILVLKDGEDKVLGVLANYACHCTTLGTFNQVHGDWAGYAQDFIAQNHPGAIGLVSIGCGADSNPHPRGSLANARDYGREIATEVQAMLQFPLEELTGPIECRAEDFDLPFDPLPSLEEWKKRAEQPGIVGYHARINLKRLERGEELPIALPYQAQTWNFGRQLAMVFLPGEVVVDYSVRLKREFDRDRLWVSGYANWVPCYIPSERILQEGGYEAETSLWYYDRPARLSPETESLIIASVHRLLPEDYLADPQYASVPKPKSPLQSLTSMRAPGLRVELIAAEPLIASPVGIDWSSDGALLVVERDTAGMLNSRVKMIKDTDGDAVHDRVVRVIENADLATGIAFREHIFDDFENAFSVDASNVFHHPFHGMALPPKHAASLRSMRAQATDRAEPFFPIADPELATAHSKISPVAEPSVAIYRDRLLGGEYFGNLFLSVPNQNLIRRFALEEDGVTFKASRLPADKNREFLASSDHWFTPVNVRAGPDGAIWIVDSYDADPSMGRIYRIVPEGAPLRPIRDLTKLTIPELVAHFETPNGTERERIEAELLRRRDRSTSTEHLAKAVQHSSEAAVRVHALALLEAIDPKRATVLIKELLKSEDPAKRTLALSRAARRKTDDFNRELAGLSRNLTPRESFFLTLALRNDPDSAPALAALLARFPTDRWIQAAMLVGAGGKELKTLQAVQKTGAGDLLESIVPPLVRSALETEKPESTGAILDLILSSDGHWAGWQFETASDLLRSASSSRRIARALRSEPQRGKLANVLTAARRIIADPASSPERKEAATSLLASAESAQ